MEREEFSEHEKWKVLKYIPDRRVGDGDGGIDG